MMLDGVYVDMTQAAVVAVQPKPPFLPLFNLKEPVRSGEALLVAGGIDQSGTRPDTISEEPGLAYELGWSGIACGLSFIHRTTKCWGEESPSCDSVGDLLPANSSSSKCSENAEHLVIKTFQA